jgi:CysZ protein
MFLQKAAADIHGIRIGAEYFFRGARELWRRKGWWPLLIVPTLLNVLLYALFVVGIMTLVRQFLSGYAPSTWWGILIAAAIFVVTLAAVLYLGSMLFIFFGSIISAPFYDSLAQRAARERGAVIVERTWWQEVWRPIKHSVIKFGWYLLVQIGLLGLYLLPVAVGPVAYLTLGFFATAFFLALDFLDFSFDFRGWTFTERKKWCMERKGVVLGFGGAVLLGTMIPAVNIVVPPIAIIAAGMLFDDYESARIQGSR